MIIGGCSGERIEKRIEAGGSHIKKTVIKFENNSAHFNDFMSVSTVSSICLSR